MHDEQNSNILVKTGSGAGLCSDILEPEVKGKTRNCDTVFVPHWLYLHSGPRPTGGSPQVDCPMRSPPAVLEVWK